MLNIECYGKARPTTIIWMHIDLDFFFFLCSECASSCQQPYHMTGEGTESDERRLKTF